MMAGPVAMVLIDFDCALDRALLADIAEMCTVVSQRDFGKPSPNGWGTGAIVRVGQSTTDIAPNEWVVGFFSHPDVANALGYHDVAGNGQPMLHIFPRLESDIADLPVTVFHELIEALVDPTCIFAAVGTDSVVRALETGDPVESDWFAYVCASGRSLHVSNWVLPAWFGGIAGPLDHMGLCQHPFEIRPGGYQIVFDPTKGWTQVTAGEKRAYRKATGEAGRTRLDKRKALFADAVDGSSPVPINVEQPTVDTGTVAATIVESTVSSDVAATPVADNVELAPIVSAPAVSTSVESAPAFPDAPPVADNVEMPPIVPAAPVSTNVEATPFNPDAPAVAPKVEVTAVDPVSVVVADVVEATPVIPDAPPISPKVEQSGATESATPVPQVVENTPVRDD